MGHAFRTVGIGVALLLSSIALDLAGALFQSLPVLILSFALGIAGAVIAVRGIIEFIGERT
jgi:hypothetical protein